LAFGESIVKDWSRGLRILIVKVWQHIMSKGDYAPCLGMWKDFTHSTWIYVSGAHVEVQPEPGKRNIFSRWSRKSSEFMSRLKLITDKEGAEVFGNFCQSRGMPCGGQTAEKNSYDRFKGTVTSTFQMGIRDLADLDRTSFYIGEYLKSVWGSHLPQSICHISVASSGDYNLSSKAGGRGEMIRSKMFEYLTVVPIEDKIIELPYGIKLSDQKGIPRWRTWLRTYSVLAPDTVKFGELRHSYGEVFVTDERRWGFDEILGYQIYAIALLEAKQFGFFDPDNYVVYCPEAIPSKLAFLPETGGKVRIVTTTLWWNIIIQQPVGHFFREVLSRHPAARDGLSRSEQAACWIKRLNKVLRNDSCRLLSSDLSEATDVIPPEVSSTLLGAFARGLGLGDNEVIQHAIVLACSSRRFEVWKGSRLLNSFISTRGIMMGECLSKAALTLLNLACEQEAFEFFYLNYTTPARTLPAPCEANSSSWRCLHLVGDDHGAHGPLRYLHRITANHNRWGSKVSADKHAIGMVVKFCEDIVFWDGSPSSEYEGSYTTNTVKARLLSTAAKSREILDEANPAMGKGLALGARLKTFESVRYPLSRLVSIRDRFIFRMQWHLPRDHNLLSLLLTPRFAGGLGLYQGASDFEMWYSRCDVWAKKLLAELAYGENPLPIIREIRSMTTVSSKRGFELNSVILDNSELYGLNKTLSFLNLPEIEESTIDDLYRKYDSDYELRGEFMYDNLLRKARADGWYDCDGFLQHVLRGPLFNTIVSNDAKVVRYQFVKWPSLRKRLFTFSEGLTNCFAYLTQSPAEIYTQLSSRYCVENQKVFRSVGVSEEITIYDRVTKTLRQAQVTFDGVAQKGLPTLRLPNLFSGVNVCLEPAWAEVVPQTVMAGRLPFIELNSDPATSDPFAGMMPAEFIPRSPPLPGGSQEFSFETQDS